MRTTESDFGERAVMANLASLPDETLVLRVRSGNADAFQILVERYRSVVTAVTYSVCGNLAQSEDLAQETFLAAWRSLGRLQEPARFAAWLTGIARNLSRNFCRRQAKREAGAVEIGEMDAAGEKREGPVDFLIGKEEAELLWRRLSELPETYREPLVMFYRQDQSVEEVARALDLSQEAVRQRLSRGRSLLRDQMADFVEKALASTKPGKAFVVAVMAALPVAAPQAGAATVASLAGSGAAAKAAGASVAMGAVMGPVLGLLGGVLGACVSIANAKSPRERRFMVRASWVTAWYVLFFLASMGALIYVRVKHGLGTGAYVGVLAAMWVFYGLGLVGLILKMNKRVKQIQIEDGTYQRPVRQRDPAGKAHEPSAGNAAGAVWGSLVGALCWPLVEAVSSGDWLAALILAGSGGLIGTWCYRRAVADLSRTEAMAARGFAAATVVVLMLVNVRWGIWFEEWNWLGEGKLRLMANGLLVLVYGGVSLALWAKGRRRGAGPMEGAG